MLVKNASNLPLGIFSCSSPVPLGVPSPHTQKVEGHVWRARAPPGYMAPAPLLTQKPQQFCQYNIIRSRIS